MREALQAYVQRVRELADHCKGNEQATKQSLIGPLFTLLGYDLTDPRECRPEFKADFGKDRSTKPVDYAFLRDGRAAFFVEAKEVGRKLQGFDEQLADYFAKAPEVKLGILTNGVQWRFFTDLVNVNVMDREPFVRWDVLSDDPPFDLLTILQKREFNTELIRTFALRRRNTNLLIAELSRLLEPAPEFTRLAVANVETRNLTAAVIDGWKPVVAAAIGEWVKQRMLANVLGDTTDDPEEHVAGEVDRPPRGVETSAAELAAYARIQQVLGADRPVAYQDTASYFKVHLVDRPNRVVCRLHVGRRKNHLAIQGSAGAAAAEGSEGGWTSLPFQKVEDIDGFADLLQRAWDERHAD